MLGNLRQWCADEWSNTYTSGARDASESPSAHRVIRGGSWSYDARNVRAAYRYHNEPSNRSYDLGFRCAEFRPGS
jgi:formylglycine-generating enzyme required for sulfatase activity